MVAPLVMLAVVLLAGCSATGADEPTRAGNQDGYVGAERSVTIIPPDERKPAPDIKGAVLGQEGKEISTADLTGKVVVLNVWGSWCGPCRAEAPALQKASEATAGVAQFIGLNTRDFDQGPPVAFNRSNTARHRSSPVAVACWVEATMSVNNTVRRARRDRDGAAWLPVSNSSISVAILSGSVNHGAWSAPSSSTMRAPGMWSPRYRPDCTGMAGSSRAWRTSVGTEIGRASCRERVL